MQLNNNKYIQLLNQLATTAKEMQFSLSETPEEAPLLDVTDFIKKINKKYIELYYPQIKVLDKGYIKLIDVMGDDDTVCESARVSTNSDGKDNQRLIHFLMREGHTSPFEFVEFSFEVKAPFFVLSQWVRHRTGNYSVLSSRYTKIHNEFYIPTPDKLRYQSTKNKQCSGELLPPKMQERVLKILNDFNLYDYDTYEVLLDCGLSREQAGRVLSDNRYVSYRFKIDLKNLFNLLSQRLAPDAQPEFREYAQALAEVVRRRVPMCYNAFEIKQQVDAEAKVRYNELLNRRA